MISVIAKHPPTNLVEDVGWRMFCNNMCTLTEIGWGRGLCCFLVDTYANSGCFYCRSLGFDAYQSLQISAYRNIRDMFLGTEVCKPEQHSLIPRVSSVDEQPAPGVGEGTPDYLLLCS